ncbi:MAG: hypothetical protein KDD82_15525 [Planctomycetes bacterium]|nr:hypothetical protein [Planctomycetota bacterium]
MSEAENAPEKSPFGPVAVFVVGGFLGLVALVYLTTLIKKPPQGRIQELPHAAVMLEFNELDSVTRQALVKLQDDLEALGLAAQGPKNFPLLVPGGELPTPVGLATITDADFALAKPWLHAGGWLVPRVYSPDLTSAVIRLAPKDRGPFPSGTATRVLEVLEKHKHAGPLTVYSRALGLEEEAARSKINVTFGVQTANVRLLSEKEGELWKQDVQKSLHEGIAKNPRVRSATTFMSFALYVTGVILQIDNPTLEQVNWTAARTVGQLSGSSGLVSKNGKMAWLEVTTDAEGEANLEITILMASNLPTISDVRVDVPRKRKSS